MSHYITEHVAETSAAYNPNGKPSRYLRAVCGAVVAYTNHTIQPTCPTCAAWVVAQDAQDTGQCPF